jgi:activating signal cointegrator 1
MRILSLTQPWATLMTLGKKRYETRSWSTKYRGLVAIHAAKGFPRECRALCEVWPFSKYVTAADHLPRGFIVAVAELTDVIPTEDFTASLLKPDHVDDLEEVNFGNYAPDRFAWKFIDIRALKTPVLCRGSLGLRKLDLVTEQLVTMFS